MPAGQSFTRGETVYSVHGVVGRFRFFTTVCLCLAAGIAPLLMGKVLCTTADGHYAIESSQAADCNGDNPDDGGEPHDAGEPAPCDDRPIADDGPARPASQSGVTDHIALTVDWSTVAPSCPGGSPAPPLRIADYAPLPDARSQSGLRTIVLLT